jgi:hypothetical protein
MAEAPMRLTGANGGRRVVLVVAMAAAALTACIIGPKQDDPEAPSNVENDTGTGTSFDTSPAEDMEGGKTSDTSIADTGTTLPPSDTMAPAIDAASDTGCVADADGGDACVVDATPDAVTDAADGG